MTTSLTPGLVLVAAVALGGCMTPPVASAQTDNEQVAVDTLFTHDGCTMYRFRADYRYHYYARCSGSQPEVQTMSPVSCGKNCVRDETVATIETH